MDLPNPGVNPRSSTLQVDTLPAEPQGKQQQKKEVIVKSSSVAKVQARNPGGLSDRLVQVWLWASDSLLWALDSQSAK